MSYRFGKTALIAWHLPLVCAALFAAPCAEAQAPTGRHSSAVSAASMRPVMVGDERPEWARTLQRITDSVVTIQIDAARSFDTEWGESAQATGFVVDAERGLILTNRHVVTPGPVTAQAVFQNREEVQLFPVYRDPVHDFGIYRYDPAKLKFAHPTAIVLAPDAAKVGTEIRVVGNDAGEQLSILSGTLARLDRDAPLYGIGKYNDFNTFYYQAASSTSGGSSGSPVINVRGEAVALNAGGSSQSASSFYLPLDRVVRALKLIQGGMPISRGALQVVFGYTPYDELERLGLDAATEAIVRHDFPHQVGMLVVREVQPGSSCDGVLEPGDVLLRINGRFVTEFLTLESILDESIGGSIQVEFERGGQLLSKSLVVDNLHAITPDEYVEIGEAVVHRLSYQQARHLNVPISGIYVAHPGYMFSAAGIARGAVITEFNGKSVQGIDDFEKSIASLGDGARATFHYFTLEDTRNSQLGSVVVDRRWFPAQRCKRDDSAGSWRCRALIAAPVAVVPILAGSTTYAKTHDLRADRLAPSLVMINFDMPYTISGITEHSYRGTGVIVDTHRGLIVTDRNTVPVALGDVRLTFAGTIEVPGHVEYINPLHNLAVVSYDPTLIGTTPVQAATFSGRELAPGESVWVVGLRADQRLGSLESRVAAIAAAQFPLSRTFAFRDSNLEVVTLVNPPSDFDGVITDERGDVRALYASFMFDTGRELQQQSFGIPAETVMEMIERVKTGQPLHSLEAELAVVPLSAARKFGLNDAWIKKVEAHSPARRQVLSVTRLVAGSKASSVLQTGDIILAVDGVVANRFREVESSIQKEIVRVTVWRAHAELNVEVPTAALTGTDVERIVRWAGATLQAPHRALASQRGIVPNGVFVSFFSYGSPATRYGLWSGRRITEVDGKPTPDLDSFLAVVKGKEDRASLRLKIASWNNLTEVITLKLDKAYWPAYELVREPSGWQRHSLE